MNEPKPRSKGLKGLKEQRYEAYYKRTVFPFVVMALLYSCFLASLFLAKLIATWGG